MNHPIICFYENCTKQATRIVDNKWYCDEHSGVPNYSDLQKQITTLTQKRDEALRALEIMAKSHYGIGYMAALTAHIQPEFDIEQIEALIKGLIEGSLNKARAELDKEKQDAKD